MAVPAAAGSEVPIPAGWAALADQWGIQPVAMRLSSAGYMLDFRYRILDPDKALPLMDRASKPYLIDQASGAKFLVPSSPKVGAMRAMTVKPLKDRVYFILFANPAHYVKAGNRVTVVVGDINIENLIVE